jgi:hypothetical protein
MAKDNVDETIRQYLRYLSDPNGLVDLDKVSALEAAAERTSDLLERLRIYSELGQLSAIDVDAIKAKFIKHAGRWAKQNGVSAEAFRRMNVPEEVLMAAKLLHKTKASRRATNATPGNVAKRRSRVTTDTILALVPDTGDFTVKSIAEASGASDATVRKVIMELEEKRKITQVGTERSAGARGRGAAVYRSI